MSAARTGKGRNKSIMDLRPILMIVGSLLATLALLMCVPAVVDAFQGRSGWRVFAASAGITLFAGVALTLTSNTRAARLSVRQAFLVTVLTWLSLCFFGALPFMFSELELGFTDAMFESVSGLTTTGSTILTNLDEIPPGLLLWRALLQWLGGIGIIVMAIAVLPMLNVGGMQLFRMESSDQSDKALPRAAQIASAIGVIYVALTIIWAGAYWLAGMSGFDAIAHSMTTIATGGFSTHDASIGHFDSAMIDYIAALGMLVGSLPFILYLKTLQGDARAIGEDPQVQWFVSAVAAIVLATACWLWLERGEAPDRAMQLATFNVLSIITGTGYATDDYSLWGSFALPVFFFIMFIGGCAGSTTCGIKVFRFQVLYAAAKVQVQHLLQPSGVFIPYYNKRPITDDVIISVLSFFFIWFFGFTMVALGLALAGLDFLTAFSSAATAIANVGPALGPVSGPANTFQGFPDEAKWLMAGGMLLGRLEMFTVIVLFTRAFWRS